MTRSYFDFKPCGPSNRYVFTDYSTLYAHLTAQGPTYKKAIPLYPIGTTSSEENIIGHWGYNSSGAIVPMGEVRFTKVTPSQYGVVSALDGGFPTTICTLAGHNITATSGTATVWDTTGAVELSAAGGVSWTRVGDVFTFAVAQAGLAVGDQVFVRGISEFSIGGATRDVQLNASDTFRFIGTGAAVLGMPIMAMVPPLTSDMFLSLRANIISGYQIPLDDDYVLVGWRKGAVYVGGGVYRYPVNHLPYGGRNTSGLLTPGGNIPEDFARILICSHMVTAIAATFNGNCNGSTVAPIASIAAFADIVGATCRLMANKGATFSSLRLG